MPGVTGGVTERTPRQEQLEVIEAARARVETAATTQAAIEGFVAETGGDGAGVDATVADFVRDAHGQGENSALVGIEQDLRHPDSDATETALNELPPAIIAEAVGDEIAVDVTFWKYVASWRGLTPTSSGVAS